MKYIPQLDQTDCGAACLAMIASHFGKRLSIAKIREKAGTDIIGTNLNGIVCAAKEYGLRATALKGSPEALSPSLPCPFIVHMHQKLGEDNWSDHFVVIKKITAGHIYIFNPDPLVKKQKLTYEEFLKSWTNYAIFFEPEVNFSDGKDDKTVPEGEVKKHTGSREKSLILKFLPVFLPHKKLLVYSFFCSILLLAFGLVTSFYYKYIFDEVIYSKASFSLVTVSLGVLMVTVFQSIAGALRSILLAHFSFKTDLHLNFSYLSHIFKLPLSFFESRKSGEILSRLEDLGKIKETLSSAALSGVMDLVMLLVSGPFLFHISPKLFFISFITVLLVSFLSVLFSSIYRKYYAKVMTQNAEVQSCLFESINGAATVKAMNAEEYVHNEYEKKKMAALESGWNVNGINILQGFLSGIINGISGILVYWVGSSSIIGGTLSAGTLITFNSLLGYFTGPLFRLVNIQNSVQESFVAARRVGEVLELEEEMEKGHKYLKPEKLSGDISFENVSFAYGKRVPVYENLNLKIEGGSWTAFVGPSGSGKSTLIKLILKFYEVQDGRIFLDGNDIRDIDTVYLRSRIGYVPQDIFLFSGTIAENIALHHPEASLDEIMEAARKAGADEFIQKQPKRYETILGEHGGGLSGGEKQRLALARALLGKPEIIILDEATSSLDSVTEMEIHQVLRNLRKENITVILIAHRLSTIQNCDRIYVMKNGKISESGNHFELLQKDGLYKQMITGQAV